MSTERLVDRVTTIFGTRNELHYRYLWIAEIRNYYKCEIAVATVRTQSNEMRGLLLVPTLHPPIEREFGGPNPVRYVSLVDYKDPVKESLQLINLLPEKEVVVFEDDDDESYFFKLHTFSKKFITHSSYGPGPTQEQTLVHLWESLKLATKIISDAYKNEEINACLETLSW